MRVIVLDKESFVVNEFFNVTKIEFIASTNNYQITGVNAVDNQATVANYPAVRFIIRIMSNQ